MVAQLKIPCLFMRGGTSRGTYFLRQHLPATRDAIDRVLLRVMGSPDPRQIDGMGGATSVTSKVAILAVSKEPGVDVDYTFAQVAVAKANVDWEPSCGNMLAGVGPAAIEMGLIRKVGHPVTPVMIRATNNGALVEAIVQTPHHEVTYDADDAADGVDGVSIDGVPGSAAPVTLNFKHIVGSKTGGKLLPTGQLKDVINGVEVTCIDVAMPIVIANASSLGKTGYESKEELDSDTEFFKRIEAIRVSAGEKMGLGDVSNRVIPKFAIVTAPKDREKHNIAARYFVPDKTHTAMAVTGAICLACCSILKGSVADAVSVKTQTGPTTNLVVIEHPSGKIQATLDSEQQPGQPGMTVNSAGVLRTCRLLFEGSVRVRATDLHDAKEFQSDGARDKYRQFHSQLHKDFRRLYQFRDPETGHDALWQGDESQTA